ncbi:MAG: hydroxymethylbilane synthase, partial [Thermoguttaceae bacterium]
IRRRAQLLSLCRDWQMEDIRGNVDTRLRKLGQGEYHAIVLAEAGLLRLDRAVEITQVLPLSVMLPAPGQGALGLEIRRDDKATQGVVARLDDLPTHQAVTAERAMLGALQGGCSAPIGAWARVETNRLLLSARVLSPDGQRKVEVALEGDLSRPEELAGRAAEQLLRKGAEKLINRSAQ